MLSGCKFENAPKGLAIDYPYFITRDSLLVKKIMVPKGTKLIYEENPFVKGEQFALLDENKLTTIKLPYGETISWAGVPVTEIDKFYNEEMRGVTVYADFEKLSADKRTKFSELWRSCEDGLGVGVKNIDDWSFNPKNISDIESCSVLYQRFFKDSINQQKFLDNILIELKKLK